MTLDPRQSQGHRDAMNDLLADLVLNGQDETLQQELDALRAEHGSALERDIAQFEAAAAAASLAMLGTDLDAPPAALRARLTDTALDHLANAHMQLPVAPTPAPDRRGAQPPRASSVLARLGWPVAIAASLALLVLIWPMVNRPSAARQRQALLTGAPDVLTIAWTATADAAVGPSGVQGDVVWSNARNEGYMVFNGLAVNDPNVEQYQLWIFDREQPEATPVSGGVFDIPVSGEVIVPIDPAIAVKNAYLFAITREKPGGVVVSDRQRLPVLAQVPQQGS